MKTFAISFAWPVLLLSAQVAAVSAQSVLVEVRQAETGAPVAGAFVSLLDASGAAVRSRLTNELGQFLFQNVGAGRLQIQAEMLGRQTQVSNAITLIAGETARISLHLPQRVIALNAIRVEVEERCRLRPAEATATAQVWEEARKTLTVQAWTEREGIYRLQISMYERDLDPAGRTVQRENRRERSGFSRTPFATLPPEELLGSAFVRPLDDGGYEYFAPDATTLLSDPFLDTHCMRLTRSREEPGAIGLAFEPVTRTDRADVEGTLWLDEATTGLRHLDYRYTSAPYQEARGLSAGRVEFRAMPNGAWIVDRWFIRAPLMAKAPTLERSGDSGIRVVGIRETGGEVVGVSTAGHDRISRVMRGAVEGVVWDSIRSQPLAGATVYLSGTGYSTSTNEDGRFRLEDLAPGVFTATFTHPRLDTLGIVAPAVEVEITAGESTPLKLATPSEGTMLLVACHEVLKSGESVLTGIVRDATSNRALPAATVRVEWQTVERMEPRLQASDHWFEVRTDTEGRYTACGVPVDEVVRVRPSFLTYSGTSKEIAFAEPGHRAIDLTIDLPAALFAGRTTVSRSVAEAAVQGVQGVLTELGTGKPIPSAVVSIRNTSGVAVSSVTDASGFFRLQTVVTGSYLFTGSALGYAGVEDKPVDVMAGKLAVIEVSLAPEALALEPLIVTAEARTYKLEMQGFYERRLEGQGIFMTPEQLQERRPAKTTDMFFGLPGTIVGERSTGIGGRAIYFRSGYRDPEICWPMIYMDRHLLSTGGLLDAGAEPAVLDELVSATDVLAIEVYRTPSEIPPSFNGPNAGCGVIVIWTRSGRGG